MNRLPSLLHSNSQPEQAQLPNKPLQLTAAGLRRAGAQPDTNLGSITRGRS